MGDFLWAVMIGLLKTVGVVVGFTLLALLTVYGGKLLGWFHVAYAPMGWVYLILGIMFVGLTLAAMEV